MSNYILLKQSNEENCNVTNNEIVQKLWKMADVLRDDGISYQNYVTELTYILFLKMMKEQETESVIPKDYRWDNLVSKEGLELKKFSSYRSPNPSCLAEYQSKVSISLMIFSRFLGSSILVEASA